MVHVRTGHMAEAPSLGTVGRIQDDVPDDGNENNAAFTTLIMQFRLLRPCVPHPVRSVTHASEREIGAQREHLSELNLKVDEGQQVVSKLQLQVVKASSTAHGLRDIGQASVVDRASGCLAADWIVTNESLTLAYVGLSGECCDARGGKLSLACIHQGGRSTGFSSLDSGPG